MRTALEKLRLRRYDALVLDLAVSPVDALRLAMDLRSRTDLPMVLLARDAVSRTHGLGVVEVGYPPLHDGLDLPNMRERVQDNVLRFDDFVIDLAAMRATCAGDAIDLTPTEFKLLVALAERPGHVLSREELLLRVWNYTDGDGGRLVDVHIGRLRKKLRQARVDEVDIETARGFGYRMALADEMIAGDELRTARP